MAALWLTFTVVAIRPGPSQAKKRQIYLEETYGGSMRELELLLHNFQLNGDKIPTSKHPKGKKGDAKDKENLSPVLVLETLRHTLTDYQKRLGTTSQEVRTENRLT